MFSIFRKKQAATVDLSALECDMHSHFLPGIDDGAPDAATSQRLMKGMQELGYKRLITTPHILWDVYKNDAASIGRALLQLELADRPLPLRAAAEYSIDDHFGELLENNEPLLTLKDNWVLIEFSFVSAPLDTKEKVFNLQIKGYRPVLAHPERYLYMGANKKWYEELRDMGCLFQVNLLSLAGYYGKQEAELAQYLVKKQYVDLLGTDMHHERHLRVLQSSPQIMPAVQTLLHSGRLLNPTL